ncbi:MAG: biopolymer transporter ExbD [Myxococcota bacterium]
MASIDTGSAGGRKQVDQEVPLVPFVDLLFCVIMFLLAVAVWNPAARIDARQASGEGAAPAPAPTVALRVEADGYVLASSDGVEVDLPMVDARYDDGALGRRLRALAPDQLRVLADDGVRVGDVVHAMDVALGAGVRGVALGE